MANVDVTVETREDLDHAWSIRTGIPPDPAQERKVEALGAPFGEVGA